VTVVMPTRIGRQHAVTSIANLAIRGLYRDGGVRVGWVSDPLFVCPRSRRGLGFAPAPLPLPAWGGLWG
jgi:hypothetical protein